MFRTRTFLMGLLTTSPVLMAFSYPSQAQNTPTKWFWVVLILVVVLPILWWWLHRDDGKEPSRAAEEEVSQAAEIDVVPSFSVAGTSPPPEQVTPPATPQAEPPTPDDLKRIEGIGPKISSLLQGAGIITFAQLAESSVDRLKQIVDAAGLSSIANPSTWPEQAALAAAGKWDELEALQDELKGGRRV